MALTSHVPTSCVTAAPQAARDGGDVVRGTKVNGTASSRCIPTCSGLSSKN